MSDPLEQDERRPRGAAHWLLLAAAPLCILTLVVLATLVTPSPAGHGTHTQLGLPPCWSMQWLGVPCPGCGVTTSAVLVTRGRLLEALHNQPLGLLVAALLLVYPLWALGHALLGHDLRERARSFTTAPWMIAAGVAILAAWVYKLVSGFEG